ncbi:Aspartokinase [hydrothermal vent metagenome]|uniref:aspartate kinase n=1 Tax=hydrothermal vent metagenome TaxID=652676 RepID=A0A3B1CDE0_9ZZZZ
MALIVQKYGGTSVGSIELIKRVAKKVAKSRKTGNDLVVVVSAMSGTTDRLIRQANQISDHPPEREMDLLMSTGERVSAALLAITLNAAGVPAASLTGRQVGMITDAVHMKARIKQITGEMLRETLKEGKVAVVAGFQGINEVTGAVTTLGRGGSDISAMAIAAALGADLCEIYTDVEGVYTTDPRIVKDARRLETISFDEMLEMASMGAKVLQTRSVEFGKKYNIPICVKSTFTDGKGTLVTHELKEMEKVVVSAIAYDLNQAKITLTQAPDMPGVAARLFSHVAENHVNVDMIIQNTSVDGTTDISFTVPKSEMKLAIKIIKPFVKEIGANKVEADEKIGKVSIIGVGMRSHTGVAAKAFRALAREKINIIMISTSEIKVSCVVSEKDVKKAVRALHDAFNLKAKPKARKTGAKKK